MNGTALLPSMNGRNGSRTGSIFDPESRLSGTQATASAQRFMFFCSPRNSMNALAAFLFLLRALTPRPTTTPAGIQTRFASSAPGTGNMARSSGLAAALRKSGSTADTWIAIAALPVATIDVCCSKVVPLGLSLKYPRFCNSRYMSRASAQPEFAKLAWPACICSSNFGFFAYTVDGTRA